MNSSHGSYVDSKQVEIGNVGIDDERWALALRIASSRQLFKAVQLREILLYLCQRVLSDPNTIIREHEIGCSVLGRRADFNPNDDNIVRVQISHLRKKLDEYFNTDGQAETLVLTIPKGSYAPRFGPRMQPVLSVDAGTPSVTPVLDPPPVRVTRPPNWWVFPCIVLIVSVGIIGFLLSRHKPEAAAGNAVVSQTRPERLQENLIWSEIFSAGSSPSIVVADTCLVMLQDTLGTDISLADYIGGHYPENLLSKVSDEQLRRTLTLIASRQYTSLGDVDIASSLLEVGQRLGANASIHYARHLNIRDFQSGNFVLIGSRRGNPWVGLFEPQLNFSIKQDPRTHIFYFFNRDPRSGEPSQYLPVLSGSSILESYADIALVPNLGKTGYVLILNGITMEASEAAGELLTRQDFPPALRKIMRTWNTTSAPRSLEILIRVRTLGGAASNSDIISYRVRQ